MSEDKWRPEGWINPNEDYHDICDVPTVQDAEYEAFEAGADAMLKELRKEGVVIKENDSVSFPPIDYIAWVHIYLQDGVLAFIPDEPLIEEV